ncbi:hypothetical protein GC194_13395, partial [bacterium]|nr:hypothetical protein [bacterium]
SASMSYTYNAIGDANMLLNNFERAKMAFKKATKIASQQKDIYVVAATQKNTGDSYSSLHQYDSAIVYYEKSLDNWKVVSDKFQQLHTNIYYAQALMHTDKNQQAILILNEVWQQLDSTDFIQLKDECLHQLSKAEAISGNYESAYNNLLRFEVLHDTLDRRLRKKEVAQMQAEFKTKEMAQANKLLKANADKNRIIWICIAVSLLGIILTMIIIQKQRKRAHQTIVNNQNRIFSIIAHDLKNPIGALAQLLEMLRETNANDPIIKMAHDSADATYKLLENLLLWARSKSSIDLDEKKEHSVYDIVQGTLELYKSAAHNKTIELENKLSTDIRLKCHKNIMETVFRNLLNNAIKFTPKNGKVSFGGHITGKLLHLTITDTGIGIDPKKLQKFYDEFRIYSTKGTDNEDGTGMGLRICDDLIQKEGGEMKIESAPGKGTTVHIFLPIK